MLSLGIGKPSGNPPGKPPGKPPSLMLSLPKGGNPPKPKGFSPRLSPEVVTLRVSSSMVMSFLVLMPRQPSPVATMLRVPLPENSSLSLDQMTAALWLAVSLQAVMVSVFTVPLAATTSTFFLFFRSNGAPSRLVRFRPSSFILAFPADFSRSCPSSLLPFNKRVSL